MTTLIVLLIVFGLVLILVEAVVPGGVVGSIGGALMIAGVVLSFIHLGPAKGGWILAGTLAATAVVVAVMAWYVPRSKMGRLVFLSDIAKGELRDARVDMERQALIGREGKALTDLRPSGRGIISGKKWDVVSSGSYIDRDESFRVVRVEGPRIVVEPTTDK